MKAAITIHQMCQIRAKAHDGREEGADEAGGAVARQLDVLIAGLVAELLLLQAARCFMPQ